jgi:hypothetical protein
MGITNKGKAAMAKKLGGLSADAMTYLAFGDSDTAFAKTQNALVGTEHMREAATVASATTTDTDDTLQLSKSFSISSSMTAKEVGVFDAATSGNMGARTVVSTKSLTNGSTYSVVYKIIVSAS